MGKGSPYLDLGTVRGDLGASFRICGVGVLAYSCLSSPQLPGYDICPSLETAQLPKQMEVKSQTQSTIPGLDVSVPLSSSESLEPILWLLQLWGKCAGHWNTDARSRLCASQELKEFQ